ncbi:IS3 family transposase [Candidatus Poriferisodalis sp.]|uniref:IS3 family transposase n=1 Tax=Candidatus Poriferisodalis sp. TaxID=3101277 RepID=UPI003B02AF55
MDTQAGRAATSRRYSAEQKQQAVRMVFALREELGTSAGTVTRVARQLGYGEESLRRWVAQAEVDAGARPGVSSAESGELKKLRQENRELRRANEILQRAAGFFRGGARPPTAMIVEFVDANREEFGVEPVCAALQAAPSTYWSAKRRPPSARALRDAKMMPLLLVLWQANYCVYGARKLWVAARRAGHDIGRDQVARLMGLLDIRGVQRTKRVRTTRADPKAARPPDLVERDFTADAPNRLWVADLTHVPTWSGVAYVCFITDAFSRRIVGWRVASNMATQMVLDALEMARWARGARLEGLIAHADAGSQFTSIRYSERLDEIGAVPSIGSVADSYDNALAEAVNSLYKTELIRGPGQGPWRTIDDVELATLGWVHWWNTDRIHGYLHDQSPDQFEAAYAAANTDNHQTKNHNIQPAQNPG